MFYWTSKSAISVEKGAFLSPRIREKGVFFKLGYERGVHFGREWGVGVGWGSKGEKRLKCLGS